MTANLVKWVEEELEKDEEIEAVVIGDREHGDFDTVNDKYKFKPIDWNTAKVLLDYEFDSGYGLPECHPIYVWTNKRIFVVATYDGATWLHAIPRNPGPCKPEFIGG